MSEEESLLSQDDIDSLMNFGLGDDQDNVDENGEDQNDGAQNEEDEAAELSQDDIDALMGGGNSSPDPVPDEEEEGELSQEDIDRMLGKGSASEDEEDEDISELISMDDIQKVINSGDENSAENIPENSPEGTPVPEFVPSAQKEDGDEEEDESDFIIDESEAGALEDNLILQEVLDALMQGPLEDIPQEAVTEEGSTGEPEAGNSFDPAALRAEPSQESDALVILEDAAAEPDVDPEDITQQDIDSLLMESDDEPVVGGDEDDILISEDDINTLLMVVDQEDEDLLGDIAEPQDSGFADFQDQDSDDQPVVLEGLDGEDEAPQASSSSRPWFASRLFLVAASVLLFIAIAVPATYFLFFSKDQDPLVADVQSQDTLMGELAQYDTETEIDTDDFAGLASTGQLVLKGFIVPVADSSHELAYVEADVSIDYTDQRIPDEIQSNISFYRDIVFDAIKTGVEQGKKEQITAAALIWAVENSLKKVLPGRFIEKVGFSSFSSS